MGTAKSILELKPRFTREDLRELMRAEDGWRLSLFMPLARTGRDVRQAPILLKDLRGRAARELENLKASPTAIEEILGAVDQVLAESETAVIQGDGLVIFASEHQAFTYLLPVKPAPAATVGRRFQLEPILPLLYEDVSFYVLTLGLKHVRLYEGDSTTFTEIPLDGVSTDMREALHFEDGDNYVSNFSFGGAGGSGARAAMFYGNGTSGDMKEIKRDVLRFFQMLDDGVKPLLTAPDRPLLLSGVEDFLPIYREANTYPRIMDVSLPAHLDKISGPADLHAKAWPLIERETRAGRKALLSLYRERLASPWTSAGLSDIVPLSEQGRLSHLFIRQGYRGWGAYEPETGKVFLSEVPQDGDEDLVSLAAAQTLLSGGKVYMVGDGEIPEEAGIAALCRY